jgi:prepilin-type N-terminal cleavage/methylation domain-containing protein
VTTHRTPILHPQRPRIPRHGFSIAELLAVILILALVAALVIPSLRTARAAGRLSVCLSNLKQFSVGAGTYSTDFSDRIFSFSWKADRQYGNAPDLTPQAGDNSAAAAQAVDIIRRRGDRPDLPASLVRGWIPHVLYSHLPLQDYLAHRLPEPMVACPEDAPRLDWQTDPTRNFDRGAWLPQQPDPTEPRNKRWPYSSSYELVPAAYDASPVGQRISQPGTLHYEYVVPGGARLGSRSIAEVRFPSMKVQMHDSAQRHEGRRRYYADPNSRQPLLMFDGSVVVRRTGDSQAGWDPNSPAGRLPTLFIYRPRAWEVPSSSGGAQDWFEGYYRWTREGLAGIDFGAAGSGRE